MTAVLRDPLLLVGTGRCGSTILYSLLAMHPDLAWIPSWVSRFPGTPGLAALNRIWALPGTDRFRETRFFPKPVEPNRLLAHWDADYAAEGADEAALTRARARVVPVLQRIRRAHGAPRLLLKMVGRPVKVTLFDQLADRAWFVHITRELKPTVSSLLRVDFYEETGTLDPWPWGPIPEAYLEFYERSGRAPEIVAAIQYAHNVAALDRQLGTVPAERQMSVRYGDVVADPVRHVRQILERTGAPAPPRYLDRISRRSVYRGADRKWEQHLTPDQIGRLDAFAELMAAERAGTP